MTVPEAPPGALVTREDLRRLLESRSEWPVAHLANETKRCWERLAALEAQAAAMREALEKVETDSEFDDCLWCQGPRTSYDPAVVEHRPDCARQRALSGDAGRDLLARHDAELADLRERCVRAAQAAEQRQSGCFHGDISQAIRALPLRRGKDVPHAD